MKTSLVVDALRIAIANEPPAPGLIFTVIKAHSTAAMFFRNFYYAGASVAL